MNGPNYSIVKIELNFIFLIEGKKIEILFIYLFYVQLLISTCQLHGISWGIWRKLEGVTGPQRALVHPQHQVGPSQVMDTCHPLIFPQGA